MIERKFWEEVRSYWILEAPPQISDRKTFSGGEIDPSLLEDPWGQDGIPCLGATLGFCPCSLGT